MSSSPQRSTRTTPRTTPKRTPLQERTQSEANEISSRVRRAPKQTGESQNVYSTSPFPTIPQQILLPSTLRKQKSSKNLAGDVFGSNHGASAQRDIGEPSGGNRRPQVKLKRSVKTLRDMYEAQAEESRPSTALSSSRPGTSNSKLRSLSSSEGLSGRFAWEQLKTISSDDLALLPSLPGGQSSLRRRGSQSSFAFRAARQTVTSSPNFRVLGGTSSPKIPVFKDLSELSSEHSETQATESISSYTAQSSPNVVQLGETSSFEDLPSLHPIGPMKIRADASPARTIVPVASSSPVRPISSSSSASRKRKRSEADQGRSFAARVGADSPFPSSPPLVATQSLASNTSPPPSESVPSRSFDESSPVIRVLQNDSSSIDQSSVGDTHANLQEAISSSPAPPVQYPVVRAPADAQSAGIVVPKRKYRSSNTSDSLAPKWPSRLSAPSQESFTRSKDASVRSSWAEELDDFDTESLAPAQAYMLSSSANNSQIRMVPDAERHEGEDEISALPGDEYDYRSRPIPNRSTSYLGSANSSQSRLGGSLDLQLERIRSYSHSRQNSLRSFRPDSSSSAMSQLMVPTWARRYYSGFYPDSFRYLAPSASNLNLGQPHQQLPPPQQRPESLATTSRSSRQSLQSIRDSLREIVPSIFRSKNRPRLEARKSHIMPGIGPLVSNPVREPATAAMSGARQARHDSRLTTRPVSFPLSLQDPRAHWNGIAEGLEHIPEDHMAQPSPTYLRPISADPSSNQSVIYYPPRNRLGRRHSESPHLHHDHRLNTGSTASRGFGHPFNRKSYISAPSVYEEPAGSSVRTSRNIQVLCFLVGFCLPFSWFIGAILPLPPRPETYHDIEKSHWERVHHEGMGGHGHDPDMDVLARLKLEKQFKGSEEVMWQNVKWWKTLNRWMSVVGVLVLVLVIVLAVVGTMGWGG